MAQFRATIEGNRGEASRLGHKGSGIRAQVNGWSGGVNVSGDTLHRNANGQLCGGVTPFGAVELDRFDIFATSGSGHHGNADGYLGYVIDGKFTPSDALRARILSEAPERAPRVRRTTLKIREMSESDNRLIESTLEPKD